MIYIKNLVNPASIKEVVIAMNNYCTNSSQIRKGVTTYFDKDCKFLQCEEEKYRSFDDILECVRTYFPKTTALELFKVLINLQIKINGRHYYPYFSNCDTIQKIKFLFYSGPCKSKFSNIEKYKSIYSWRELADLAELGTDEEIIEFLKIKHDLH